MGFHHQSISASIAAYSTEVYTDFADVLLNYSPRVQELRKANERTETFIDEVLKEWLSVGAVRTWEQLITRMKHARLGKEQVDKIERKYWENIPLVLLGYGYCVSVLSVLQACEWLGQHWVNTALVTEVLRFLFYPSNSIDSLRRLDLNRKIAYLLYIIS